MWRRVLNSLELKVLKGGLAVSLLFRLAKHCIICFGHKICDVRGPRYVVYTEALTFKSCPKMHTTFQVLITRSERKDFVSLNPCRQMGHIMRKGADMLDFYLWNTMCLWRPGRAARPVCQPVAEWMIPGHGTAPLPLLRWYFSTAKCHINIRCQLINLGLPWNLVASHILSEYRWQPRPDLCS